MDALTNGISNGVLIMLNVRDSLLGCFMKPATYIKIS